MQRRAAAAYVVFFLVIAAGAYAVIGTAQEPEISIEKDPTYELSQGDELTVDGRTYRARSVSGGSATLAWTQDAFEYTETWKAGEEQEFDGVAFGDRTINGTYLVVVPNETDVSTATLREPLGENVSTKELDGVTYVFEDADGDGTADPDELTPLDEYADANLEQIQISEGQRQYRGNTTTVNITPDGASLSWTAPKTNTVKLSGESNATLNGRSFFVYFTAGNTVGLYENPEGYAAYQAELSKQAFFEERINGFWGVVLLSVLSAILLSGMAYMPRKDT